MTGARRLARSERGTWCAVVLAIGTAALFVGKLSSVEWLGLATFLSGSLVASKTIRPSQQQQPVAVPEARAVEGA